MYKSALDLAVKRLLHSPWRLPILKKLLVAHAGLDRWVSTFAMENGLHPKHRLMNYHQFFVDHIKPQDRVLDIGCGGGHVACRVAQKAQEVIGIDSDAAYLAPAKQHARQKNLRFILGDATTYDFKQKFDAIILSNVLEHIDDRVGLLKKIAPLAQSVLIRVPMLDRDWLPLLKQELKLDYRLDPTHTIEYTEQTFRAEVAAAGYTIIHLHVRFGELYCVARPP